MRIKKWREGVLIVLFLFLVCALGFNEEEIEYEVPLKGQVTEDSCWAASMQMIILAYEGDEGEVSQEDIAQAVGYSLQQSYGWDAILKAIEYWGFCVYPQMCLTPDGWRQLLNEYGPLWVVRRTGPNITHAVVLRGISGESDNPSMYVNDPLPVGKGTRKNMSYNEFEKVYEAVEEEQPGYIISILYYCYEEEEKEEEESVQAAEEDKTIDIQYEVPLVPQQTEMSCWAAGFAMLVSWRDEVSRDPKDIAEPLGYKEQYNKKGLDAEDKKVLQYWDLEEEPGMTYTVEGFKDLLEKYGPLWVASAEPSPHIRVITGISGDGTAEGTTLYINDPWDKDMKIFKLPNKGSQYTETYYEYVKKMTKLAEHELFTLNKQQPVYVVHCK